jgi:hypothetical protein
LHVKSHALSHVAVAFAGATQRAHESPQAAGSVLLAHCELHMWYPALQVIPHWPWLHVALAFALDAHGVQVSAAQPN